MDAGRVLQDGAAALPRNDAALDLRLDLVGTGIDVELPIGWGLGQARQYRTRDHDDGAVGQTRALPGIAAATAIATALPLGAGQMLPAAGAAGELAPHRAQDVSGRRIFLAFLWLLQRLQHRRRLGQGDRRREDT